MSAADLVTRLAQAGIDPSLLAEVAQELFVGEVERKSLADRRQHERDRKARSRDSTGQRGTGGDAPPNEVDILTPTREEKPPPKGGVKKADRGIRLSLDWQPKPITGKAAEMVACWQAGALERELAKFKNYWLAKGANAARTDWQRTWVNWLISADERKPRLHERPDKSPIAEAYNRVFGAG